MADRTVSVALEARVSSYTVGMTRAAAVTNATADAMTRAATAERQLAAAQRQGEVAATRMANAQSLQAKAAREQRAAMATVGKALLGVGVAAGVGLGAAVKASMDFNREMALTNTLAGKDAKGSFAELRKQALTAGTAFGFTATQAAQAEQELIKAGISAKDVIGGGLVGALTLASAGQTDVATATTIAASAMTQFGLAGKDIPHIADLLSAGADKALGSVTDLGFALQQVGPQAHEAGISLDNTVGTLAQLAQAGQIGERGGTQLKQVLLQLQNPSKQAAALMRQYGISLFDANGHTKNFTQLAGNLHDSLAGLSDAQRSAALSTIFGSHAIIAATILAGQGADANAKWTATVNDQGFAAQQASGKLDSLAGDLQKLRAAFQTGLIEAGDHSTNALRTMVQAITALVGGFNSLSPALKTLAVDLGLGVAVIGLAGGAFLIAVPKIVAFREALATLRGTAASTAVALEAEAGAATAAGRANGLAAASSRAGGLSTLGRAAGPIGALAFGLFVGKQAIDASVASRIQSRSAALSADPAALAAAKAQQATLAAQIKAANAANTLPKGIGGVAGKGGAGGAVSSPTVRLKAQYDELTKAINGATDATDASTTAADANAPALIKVGTSAGAASVDLEKLNTAADIFSHRFDVAGLTDQLTEGFQALGKQVKSTNASVTGNSAAALANRDALRGQYGVAVNLIKAYAGQTDAQGRLVHSAADVRAKAKQVADAFQRGADKAGIGKKKTDDYAAALRNVPRSVSTTVTVNANLTNAERALGVLQNRLNKIAAGGANPNGYTGGTVGAQAIRRFNNGGSVMGGPPGRDTNLIWADNGEEIIRKDRAAKFRPLLKMINNAPGLADGGTVGANLADIFGSIGSTSKSDATSALQRATAALASAEDRLTKLRKSGKATAEQMTAAENRVAADRTARNRAASTLSTAGQSFASQFAAGAASTVKVDAAFIANLNNLAGRGFGFLAMQLLQQGDHTAKVIAAQAVKWSNARLGGTQTQLQKSAAQQAALAQLPARLAIESALRTSKNPTLASIAAATGLDGATLQAALLGLRKSLSGNKNASTLLRGLNSTGNFQNSSWGDTTARQGPGFTVQVIDKSGDPMRAGEKAGLGAQRQLSLSRGSW